MNDHETNERNQVKELSKVEMEAVQGGFKLVSRHAPVARLAEVTLEYYRIDPESRAY